MGLLGATCVGLYACVIMDRRLRLQTQQMYMRAVVEVAKVYFNRKETLSAARPRATASAAQGM